jgi:hypothetical protein
VGGRQEAGSGRAQEAGETIFHFSFISLSLGT